MKVIKKLNLIKVKKIILFKITILFKHKYTLRGLYKKPLVKKLINVLRGKIVDVVLDINPKANILDAMYTLNSKDPYMLLVNDDFAHGFCTLENNTLVKYKVDEYYNKNKKPQFFE